MVQQQVTLQPSKYSRLKLKPQEKGVSHSGAFTPVFISKSPELTRFGWVCLFVCSLVFLACCSSSTNTSLSNRGKIRQACHFQAVTREKQQEPVRLVLCTCFRAGHANRSSPARCTQRGQGEERVAIQTPMRKVLIQQPSKS